MARQDGGWLQTVRRVLEDISASDVAEFELAQRDFQLRLRRVPSRRSDPAPAAEAVPTDALQILAPFTGIFYRAASPTAEPYAREGDWVEAGATLGLIETMKIFNEVTTDQPGRVERILPRNGELVQAGDPLVLLVPGEQPREAHA